MIMLKTIRRHHFRELLKLQSPSNCLKNHLLTSLISSNSFDFLFLSSISGRPFSLSAQFAEKIEEKSQKCTEPLSSFFKGAVLVSERTKNSVVEAEDNSANAKLKEKLRNLEAEVRSLNEKRCENGKTLKLHSEKRELTMRKGANRSLWALLTDKETKKVKLLEPTDFGNEDPMVHKELSSDMQMFTHHLYMEGYLKDASFMPKDKFDLTCFEVSYAREFLKFAAVKFGKDHQEIAKWLSASDLKKVAFFGCPSLGRRSVKAAKRMRRFFEIEEHKASSLDKLTVCQKCTLKESCKHANMISRKGSNQLCLASVTRVLIMYAMESVPQQLVVPEEINNSVSRLLKEIINLSQAIS
ncbi:hypothetical protein Pfo_014276 [Paulownia fortunei]|nr:hypothetical protein Pfo_014276 [Paulownia fortunei]